MIRRLIITCAGKFLPHPNYPEVISKGFQTTVKDDMKIRFKRQTHIMIMQI